MSRTYLFSPEIIAVVILATLLVSTSAHAAMPPACQKINDSYSKQMMSPIHPKITRTSTGAMSGRYAMIYGEGGTTCSYVRDEAANGEAAAVYRQLHKEGGQTFDTLIWISKSSGLPLRQEQDADFGKGQKGHESLIFQYSK
jgi:hypothetical protein